MEFPQLLTLGKMGTCDRLSVNPRGNTGSRRTSKNNLRTFAPKSSYGEIFFISRLELGHKVLTPKKKEKKLGVTEFVSEKMAVEKCLNFDISVIITKGSLICSSIENPKNKLLE